MLDEKRKSLTIVMPALNEQKNIKKAVVELYHAGKKLLDEFEIIIVDDGSTDKTPLIAADLAKNLGSEIKVIRKEKNEGIGPAYFTGVAQAHCQYITCIPSDGAYPIDGLKAIFSEAGSAPVILGFRSNLNERPPFRRFLSRLVTYYVSLLTWKKIIDVNGLFIMPVSLAKSFSYRCAKYIYQMELVSYVLNSPIEYKQIPVNYSRGADKNSGMLRLPVLMDVIKTVCRTFFLKITGRLP